MKTSIRIALLLPLAAALCSAAPFNTSSAIHYRPDANSAVLSVLPAGSEPVMTADPLGSTPLGWMAVKVADGYTGYVLNGDLTKMQDVKEGASIRATPAANAPVLGTMQKGDATEITGLSGRYTQIKVQKPIVGYVRTGIAMPSNSNPAGAAAMPNRAPGADVLSAGALVNNQGAADSGLPRVFEGKVATTRRPLAPRRPYDYQINDESGTRLAYLDVGKLLATEQLDNYMGQTVVVQGTARRVTELNAIVIAVENLQLK